ncbi:heteromeric transposase endonuclease subunit TnsA [Planctobacterium marinum]|uniref:heteromeric transposase endonuclease subunit TnsA n=1 Tax=Planctobacterium marinum TaxID=1631968 RepID=UPI001E2AB21A|nr:heteromeric transposase endonuclease subunit TnsA [Planctobacterium marinum]MCC2605611.1 heteromeric transposase endonuclease subunit TnsA [Planctobacterium marinum]
MPVRTIPKNYRNVTGIAAVTKAEGKAQFESTLERDLLTLLEFDDSVDSFEVQPVKLEWLSADGRARSYTPDVLAFYRAQSKKPVLFEVKYRSELKEKWDTFKPKFKKAVKFSNQQGWRFKLMTEKEIRTPYLETAKFLLPFVRRGPADEQHMELLCDALRIVKRSTPEQLIAKVFQDEWNRAALIPTLWYLIGTRQIGIELSQKLTMSSPIWSVN